MAAATLAAAALAGCGGSAPGFPPAAEPARSPAPARAPAGELFDVGTMPEGLAVDPRSGLIAVGLRSPDVLAIFDPAKGRVVRRVPLAGSPRHLGFDDADRSVLVPAEHVNELIRVPLPRGKAVTVPAGEFPHDAVAARGRVFVGDEAGDEISVVRGELLEHTLPADEQPGGVAAAGPYLAVIAVAQRTLTVYDARSLKRLGSVSAGDGPTHIETLGRRAFVADTEGGSIREFKIGPRPRELRSTRLGDAPYGLALDARRKRLWVTLTARNEAVELAIEPGGLRRIATYPTVRQPNTIAVEPASGDAYVAGRTDGRLERIEPRGGS